MSYHQLPVVQLFVAELSERNVRCRFGTKDEIAGGGRRILNMECQRTVLQFGDRELKRLFGLGPIRVVQVEPGQVGEPQSPFSVGEDMDL